MTATQLDEQGTILVTAHAWYGDLIGGSFRLATEFAEYLAAQAHDVVYVCCDVAPERRLPRIEQINGVSVRRYPQPGGGSGLGRAAAHVIRTARAVRSVLSEPRVSAMSGHSPLQFRGAALALRGSDAFTNFTVHSPFDDELLANGPERTPFSGRLAARVARSIDGRNVRLADRVQTDSNFTQQTMTEKHGSVVARKGVTAPGWVDTDCFRPEDDRSRVRNQLGPEWKADGSVFFTVRRLEPRMGIDTLISAADILQLAGAEFQVVIGGDGSLRAWLEAMIRERGLTERVRLLGRVPEEKLPLCYAAADCFVLPTRALECFGLIVLEAFACGTPVIASRVGAIPELASIQGEEWLFTPGDAVELANRMEQFISGELCTTIDLRSVATQYDRRVILPRWERLLLDDGATS